MCRGAAVPEPVPLSDGIAGDLGCDQEELGVAGDAVICVSSCCSFDEPDRVSSQPGHALFLQPLPLACTVPPCLPRIFQVSKGLHLPSPALQTLHALNTAGYCILFWPSFLFFCPWKNPTQHHCGFAGCTSVASAASDRGWDAAALPGNCRERGWGCHSCATHIPKVCLAMAVQGMVAGRTERSPGRAEQPGPSEHAGFVCLGVLPGAG